MRHLAIIMVGLPCSGKTTFLKQKFSGIGTPISSDFHLEEMAKKEGLTYSQAFPKFYHEANRRFREEFEMRVKERGALAVDRTNLTASSRGDLLRRIPSDRFIRVAIVCSLPSPEILDPLLKKREEEGKIIPPFAYEMMKKRFEIPSLNEGFDIIRTRESFED